MQPQFSLVSVCFEKHSLFRVSNYFQCFLLVCAVLANQFIKYLSGLQDIALLLIEKGADILKLHHKTDGCPLEGAVKKRLPKVDVLLSQIFLK